MLKNQQEIRIKLGTNAKSGSLGVPSAHVNFADMVLIETLFYTGVRVSELVSIRLDEIDVERCQIRITQGKGSKDRQVPFPHSFRELLALHMEQIHTKGAIYLFESVRKHKYTDRGVRKMLARYAAAAGITRSMSPHKWRPFLFTWLKKEGIDYVSLAPSLDFCMLSC